jgi:colicin import membrane protein
MAQPEKRENSVLFSLRELRQIEESRVKEEEHAVRSAQEARQAAAQEAERKRREAEDAKVRAERDEVLRIEQAREGAEREARMRVESAEAMERQRVQAALEQQRLQHEMELRRAEVAKKRPTWMLAVTGAALVLTALLVIFVVRAIGQKQEAEEVAVQAKQIADKAVKDAQAAQDRVAQLDREFQDLNKGLNDAQSAVSAAKTVADRESAQNRLNELRNQKLEMERRIQKAKDDAATAERRKGVHLSKECLENPLAKGCS